LRTRSTPPLIDPDLIDVADLKNPVAGDPAFALWSQRQQWIHPLVRVLVRPTLGPSGPIPMALLRLDAEFETDGGLDLAELDDVANNRVPGVELGPRLQQLDLTYADYEEVVRLRRVAAAGGDLLPEEWGELHAIRREIRKRRMSAKWCAEEKSAGVTLRPDLFQIRDRADERRAVRWRATWAARQDWQDALWSRIDQENSVAESLQAAVSAAEEAVLPMLRDALVEATTPAGRDLAEKAKWVTDNLLIDASMSGCHRTTRVAQAIETIQVLLWSVRNRFLDDTYPGLTAR
jgi:hypothetical protein